MDKEFQKEVMEQIYEVHELEKMYERKTKTAIKRYIISENDPVSNLIPKKANIDLKRSLTMKLEKLNTKTEKAILEILSNYNYHFANYLYMYRGEIARKWKAERSTMKK